MRDCPDPVLDDTTIRNFALRKSLHASHLCLACVNRPTNGAQRMPGPNGRLVLCDLFAVAKLQPGATDQLEASRLYLVDPEPCVIQRVVQHRIRHFGGEGIHRQMYAVATGDIERFSTRPALRTSGLNSARKSAFL